MKMLSTYKSEFSYTISDVLGSLEAIHQGLLTKQDYLARGVIPKNLPYSIFLKEDICELVLAIDMLKEISKKRT